MSDTHAVTVNGPTDLPADELAERKRVAAVDYHKRELAELQGALKRLKAAKPVDKDKVANQQRMIDDEQSALTLNLVKGA